MSVLTLTCVCLCVCFRYILCICMFPVMCLVVCTYVLAVLLYFCIQILTENGREMTSVTVTNIMLRVLTVGGKESTGEKGIEARKLIKTMEGKGEEEVVHLLETEKGGGDRSEVQCKFD